MALTLDTLPKHYLRQLHAAREVSNLPVYERTNGQVWCNEMVDMGLMQKRGVYRLDEQVCDGAADVLHVYTTTVKGRELIGKPYTNDPSFIAQQTADQTYAADEVYGSF